MAARIPWQFFDSTIPETYLWELNPGRGKANGELNYQKDFPLVELPPAAGLTLAYQQQDQPFLCTVAGTILTQTHYQAMWKWFNKDYPIQLTDDLGRVLQILITDFKPARKRSGSVQWEHTYTLAFIVITITTEI